MATEESGASTLKHLLERRRAESPDAPAYAFIDERLNCTRLLTRASLQREAESLASTLRCAAPRGERALLLFPDGPGAVIAFWACMLAELIAVPAPAPEAGRMKTAVPRLEGIAKDCEPALVLAPSEVVEATRRVDTSFLNPARCIVVDDAAPDSPPCARHEAMQAEDLGVDDAPAYLQYTSGSTTTPRGVVIRHRNVLANCAAMAAASGTTSSSRMLSWLPYFHDYGLVSGIIAPLYAGIPAWLMKPSSFLRRPLSWLEAIERFSITHTGAPAFAYAACTRALRRTPGWRGDLSRLQFASCGAEPIDARVVDEFLDAFRPYGFEKAAFSPAYGLAEATLAVTRPCAVARSSPDGRPGRQTFGCVASWDAERRAMGSTSWSCRPIRSPRPTRGRSEKCGSRARPSRRATGRRPLKWRTCRPRSAIIWRGTRASFSAPETSGSRRRAICSSPVAARIC